MATCGTCRFETQDTVVFSLHSCRDQVSILRKRIDDLRNEIDSTCREHPATCWCNLCSILDKTATKGQGFSPVGEMLRVWKEFYDYVRLYAPNIVREAHSDPMSSRRWIALVKVMEGVGEKPAPEAVKEDGDPSHPFRSH